MENPLILLLFFWYFHTLLTIIHVWIVVSPQNFHKLSFYSMYTFWYVNMTNVTTSYERLSDLMRFWGQKTIQLHQTFTNCVKWAFVIIYGYVSLVFLDRFWVFCTKWPLFTAQCYLSVTKNNCVFDIIFMNFQMYKSLDLKRLKFQIFTKYLSVLAEYLHR